MNRLAASAPPGGIALCAPRCPLCGAANHCAASAGGRLDVDCWCGNATIERAVLARIEPALRGIACICRDCAGVGRIGGAPPN